MKKILKKRNHRLTSVYTWAVEYSQNRSKDRKERTPSEPKRCRHSPEKEGELCKSTASAGTTYEVTHSCRGTDYE
jgi:hypothetical protein